VSLDSNPPAGRSIFNFEWSINSDWDGSSGRKLDELTYLLEIDFDPTVGTNTIVSFDPINGANATTNAVQWGHAIGSNTTGNGGGTSISNSADNAAGYADLIANNNVAQNSWNYEFFNEPGTPLELFDPNTPGVYTVSLFAFGTDVDGNAVELASSSIDINVAPVPVPAALPLLGTALLGLGMVARRRRTAA